MPHFLLSRLATVLRRAPRPLCQLMLLGGLATLSACASRQAVDNRIEAQHYAALAPGHYRVPGTPDDPWGPYIKEAAVRYDVPESWIRGVMHQESGGFVYRPDGTLVTSDKGAMGLMQVMPETYDDLRAQYGLGDDPYDPHNNVLAGTAYIRQMYDLYGSPGFLAAYNGGPARLDRYLAGTGTLPDETRHYVAMIGPYIMGDMPVNRSPADQLALNQLPLEIPAGLRYGRSYGVASASPRHRKGRSEAVEYASARGGRSRHGEAEVQYATLERPLESHSSRHGRGTSVADGQPEVQYAMATPRSSHGFRLISSAQAEILPLRSGGSGVGGWAIQVGAYSNQGQARAAADNARGAAGGRSAVGSVRQAKGTVYRARLTGLSREAAVAACERMHKGSCMVLSPDAQS